MSLALRRHPQLHIDGYRRKKPGAPKVAFVQRRLSALLRSLGDKPYLDRDRFTAGDLMMTTVLRILKHTDIVTSDRRLAAYVDRCIAAGLRARVRGSNRRFPGCCIKATRPPRAWQRRPVVGFAALNPPYGSVTHAKLAACFGEPSPV